MHPFLIYTLYFTLLVSTLTYTFYSVERLIEMKKAGLLIFKMINFLKKKHGFYTAQAKQVGNSLNKKM